MEWLTSCRVRTSSAIWAMIELMISGAERQMGQFRMEAQLLKPFGEEFRAGKLTDKFFLKRWIQLGICFFYFELIN